MFKSSLLWFGVAGLLVLVLGIAFTACQWDWLHKSTPATNASTTLRNMGLLIGGGLAAVFAIWRGWVAERQSRTSQLQANIAERNLVNERYQRGVEMLGHDTLAVRMGGIYALQRLAKEHPEQYHIQTMQLFCAFARDPVGNLDSPVSQTGGVIERYGNLRNAKLRGDVQAVMNALGRRSRQGVRLEMGTKDFSLDLRSADLRFAWLEGFNLSHARLSYADFSGAMLAGANLAWAWLDGANMSNSYLKGAKLPSADLTFSDLTSAFLEGADLSGARFFSSDLSDANFQNAHLYGVSLSRSTVLGANFQDANLSGADFSLSNSAHDTSPYNYGLTQAQLDEARSDPGNPPNLQGLVDVENQEPLVWQGRSLEDVP